MKKQSPFEMIVGQGLAPAVWAKRDRQKTELLNNLPFPNYKKGEIKNERIQKTRN